MSLHLRKRDLSASPHEAQDLAGYYAMIQNLERIDGQSKAGSHAPLAIRIDDRRAHSNRIVVMMSSPGARQSSRPTCSHGFAAATPQLPPTRFQVSHPHGIRSEALECVQLAAAFAPASLLACTRDWAERKPTKRERVMASPASKLAGSVPPASLREGKRQQAARTPKLRSVS